MAVNTLRDERMGSNTISDLTRYRVKSRVLVASAAEVKRGYTTFARHGGSASVLCLLLRPRLWLA